MPKIIETPRYLKQYQFHGVDIDAEEGKREAVGACPFCNRENIFSVNLETGLWRCFSCAEGTVKGGGNIYTFLQVLWDRSDKATTDYSELARSRKLLYPDTLMHWGLCRSIITGEWLVPGYNHEGKLSQLYRYAKHAKEGRWLLWPTPDLGHQLHGMNLFDHSKKQVYLCEGVWDAMALWEVLRGCRPDDGKLVMTASETASLYGDTNVLAVPSCQVFNEKWCQLLDRRSVGLFFDNDHPRSANGKVVEPAGYMGMRRVTQLVARSEANPKSVHYLHWGEGSFEGKQVQGYNPDLPHGHDLRDQLTNGKAEEKVQERIPRLERLLSLVVPVPHEWVDSHSGKAKGKNGKAGSTELELLPCSSWKELHNAWLRSGMKMTEGLFKGLAVGLACVASTRAIGDQLWVRLIGPASCGKTTLCEALSTNRKFILPKSVIRGFHSGFKSDKDGEEDNSLLAQLDGKTLVTKDGDTLLQSPNLPQILSEARDVYDGNTSTHFRNGMGRNYLALRITWILCGTASLRALDTSELGERFLTCEVMGRIDDDLEDEILWRVVNRTNRGMAFEADGDMESQHSPEMTKAMKLTGGYVGYLRTNARELLAAVDVPEEHLRKCMKLGKFVSFMRARPSSKQDETAEREFATRLASQLTRLMTCLAVVYNKRKVDADVMKVLTSVALDTAQGKVLDVAHYLMKTVEAGADAKQVAVAAHQSEEKARLLLRFLRRIGAVETFTSPNATRGYSGPLRWRLTPVMQRLYREILGQEAGRP